MEYNEPTDYIMDILNVSYLKPAIRMLADEQGTDIITIMREMLVIGVKAEQAREQCFKERSPHTPLKKNTINIYNNKNPEGVLINNNNSKESNPIASGKSPLEKKAEAKSRKKPKVGMPKTWREDRAKETIRDEELITYALAKGYDWYAAKELFLAFVDYHESKGSKFVKWNNAFFTWIRNDIKFNGTPAANKSETVLGLYKKSDPMEKLFNGK